MLRSQVIKKRIDVGESETTKENSMRKLKNLKVYWVSLVDKGANKKEIILKNKDGGSLIKTINIAKTDPVKKMVYGIVYPVNQVDAHGDTADAETVEKACYDFMKELRNLQIDKQHNLEAQKAYVAENWIVRKGDELFPDEVGAWAQGIKIDDETLWKQCEDGDITGLSLYGEAEIEEPDQSDGIAKAILKRLGLIKDFNSEDMSRRVDDMIWALNSALHETLKDGGGTEALFSSLDQFRAAVVGLQKAGASLSQANVDKLLAAIQQLNDILNQAKKQGGSVDETVKKEMETMITASQTELLKKVEELEKKLAEVSDKLVKSAANEQDQTETTTTKKAFEIL